MSNLEPIGRDKDILKLELTFDFAIEAARLYSIISDSNQWPAGLNGRILKGQPNTRLVAALPDFTRPEFTFQVMRTGTQVLLVHDLIKNKADRARYKIIWTKWFDQLRERVSL